MMDDYKVVDKVDIAVVEVNDNVILYDEDKMLHQATITYIEDIGDCFDITAYSETTGEKEDFIVDYDEEVELWQWK